MYEIFQALTIFDWITPVKGLIEDFAHDPTLLQTNSWTFFIPYRQAINAGWNANGIESMLRENGIETWGGQITNGDFFFKVYRKDSADALYHLLRWNIPICEYSIPPNFIKEDKGHTDQPNSNGPRPQSSNGMVNYASIFDSIFGNQK